MTQCGICHGPIGIGEPVVAYDDGLAHRFRSDCDWHIEQHYKKLLTDVETWTSSGKWIDW